MAAAAIKKAIRNKLTTNTTTTQILENKNNTGGYLKSEFML